MALPLDNIIVTTMRNRKAAMADAVTKNTALFKKLSERGNVKPIDGGSTILQPIEYAENSTVAWYQGYDTIAVTPQEILAGAEFQFKLIAGTLTMSGQEQLTNSGDERVINLLETKVKNLEKSLVNAVGLSCYSDGTGNSGKQLGGLQLLVSDTPTTGTVGNINRANYTWWRNQVSKAGSTVLTKDNIQGYMSAMLYGMTRGNDQPDMIVTDNALYSLLEQSLTQLQVFTDSKKADAGFQTLSFKGIPVYMDGGMNGGCPANHMYFLNTDTIYLRPHKDRQFDVIGGDRLPLTPGTGGVGTAQDAIVRMVGWAGNMTISNPGLNGVLLQ